MPVVKNFNYEGYNHYLYKTTNTINSKIYIGIRSTRLPVEKDIYYKGSGKLLKVAFKRYGKDNFKKEILCTANTRSEILELESLVVDDNFVKQSSNYNIETGGQGCSDTKKKLLSIKLKAVIDQEQRRKTALNLSKEARARITEGHKNMSLESRQRIIDTAKKGSGKNNPSWKGWWIVGDNYFESTREAAYHVGCAPDTISWRAERDSFFDYDFVPKDKPECIKGKVLIKYPVELTGRKPKGKLK